MRKAQIFITERDAARLRHLLWARTGVPEDREYLEDLKAELERAVVTAAGETPRDVVTLDSRVRVVDLESGVRRELTVVFPSEAAALAGRISVLAPLGCAMLGRRERDIVEWTAPGGARRLWIEQVLPAEAFPAAGNGPVLGDVRVAVNG